VADAASLGRIPGDGQRPIEWLYSLMSGFVARVLITRYSLMQRQVAQHVFELSWHSRRRLFVHDS
jgi:hypothetical protein